jgi:hypothetical protein
MNKIKFKDGKTTQDYELDFDNDMILENVGFDMF